MISEQLQKKIDRSIRLLQSIKPNGDQPIEVAYSGGKDSDVILQLAKEAGINYKAIYKNTTIDPKGTIKHAREMGAEVLKPKKDFRTLIQQMGLPTRWQRFCCSSLKEYKVLDKAIMGVRRSESSKRAARYKEPTECRFYGSKKHHVEAIYPIIDWTDEDVKEFILDRGIKCAPVYYDENGNFHVERRLGCMCCPLATKSKRIEQFKANPRMLRLYAKNLKIYWDTHPDSKCVNSHNNIYEQLTHDIFFSQVPGSWDAHKNGILAEPIDYKQFLEQYFGVQLD